MTWAVTLDGETRTATLKAKADGALQAPRCEHPTWSRSKMPRMRNALTAVLMLSIPWAPALAIDGAKSPILLAQMMGMPPQGTPPAGGGMPGGPMQGKLGMTPPAAMGPGTPMAGMPPPAAAGGMAGAGSAMMPMSPAMMTMMAQMAKMQMPPALPLDRVEGRIAFIKAELGITPEQSATWDRFAQALRTAQEHLGEAGKALNASAGAQSSVPDRLQAYEHHLTMRLDSLREARISFQGLYETLTVAQKKTADELVAPILLYF